MHLSLINKITQLSSEEEKERFSSGGGVGCLVSVLTAALVSPELQTKDFHWLMTIPKNMSLECIEY